MKWWIQVPFFSVFLHTIVQFWFVTISSDFEKQHVGPTKWTKQSLIFLVLPWFWVWRVASSNIDSYVSSLHNWFVAIVLLGVKSDVDQLVWIIVYFILNFYTSKFSSISMFLFILVAINLRCFSFQLDPKIWDIPNLTLFHTLRSYSFSGVARYDWQHSIPEGSQKRWSFTFRSLKESKSTLPQN